MRFLNSGQQIQGIEKVQFEIWEKLPQEIYTAFFLK